MYKDLKEKFGFTLGATHVGISHNIGGTFHRFVESFTHVGISHNTRRVAFTLAEILITLGIIGIVSAMTIPTLVKNYKKKVLLNKIKVAHSQIVNAINLYVAQNNCSNMHCLFDVKKSSKEVSRELATVISGGRVCEAEDESFCKKYAIKSRDGRVQGGVYTSEDQRWWNGRVLLRNGASVEVSQRTECLREWMPTDEDGNPIEEKKVVVDACAVVYIDSNGPNEGPNQFGADVFRFNVTSKGKMDLTQNSNSNATSVIQKNAIDYFEHEIGETVK